ncbi:MAG: response regulator [Anaerolineae bacterium]
MPALRVLVVEDDVGLCAIYERILNKMGCQIEIAHDGHSALQLLRTFNPHLIFLDMYLPILNGLTVLEGVAVNPALAQTRVVVASSSRDYERQILAYSNTEFILKPIMPTQIRDIVAQMIESTC